MIVPHRHLVHRPEVRHGDVDEGEAGLGPGQAGDGLPVSEDALRDVLYPEEMIPEEE